MTDCPASVTVRPFAIDLLVVAGVFLFMVAAGGDVRFALPVETGLPLGTLVAGPHHHAAMLLLALVFSLLMAFNLAFFCHLFSTYASSRPGFGNPDPWSDQDSRP